MMSDTNQLVDSTQSIDDNNQPSILSSESTSLYQTEIETLPIRICLVGSLQDDEETNKAVENLGLPVVLSQTGSECITDDDFATYFILDDFESPEFDELMKHNARIIGKPALVQMSLDHAITYKARPVYCLTMKNCVIVFTGFRKKAELANLMKFIHYMGGSVKNTIASNVTHILAHSSGGEKYHYAVTFNIPVMGSDWVSSSWAYRDEMEVRAEDEIFNQYKLPLFTNLRIVFLGFSEEDQSQMEDLVQKNGGFVVPIEDTSVTHIVLDDQNISERPAFVPNKAFVVKGEWFWASIQMDACCNEQLYSFEPLVNGLVSPRGKIFSPGTPGSKSKRRKRLRETIQQLAENDSPSNITIAPASKRRSSVSDLAFLSGGDGSFIEESLSASLSSTTEVVVVPVSPPHVDLQQLSPRHRVFHELVQTECNYVAILDTINKVIKEPLESPAQQGGPMLDAQDLRYIFGNLPPIHEVHLNLRNRLLILAHNWSEDASIGKTILEFTGDLEKAYPPFVNYFENVKERLQQISSARPRFHAFLKIAQSRPECGRQSFQELLIRPVQRLPSMSLLISDLLKQTKKSCPDHSALEEAYDKIKSIVTFINDDKRKTEAKLKLFEIHNDIENCPPNLVASHRSYVSKVDVSELSDNCSGRGDPLTIFLFNDIVEICKRKSKYNSMKSPGNRGSKDALKNLKSHKHLEMVSLAHIKKVIDINETDVGDCQNVFALIVRTNQELTDKLYTFAIIGDKAAKSAFTRSLCCHMANVVCRSDVESFRVAMEPHRLDIDMSDGSLTTALNKAIKFATRTGRKVTRAFSFNRSPGTLKRAVSTVMSPFGGGAHQSMRGASSVVSLVDHAMCTPPPPPPSTSDPGNVGSMAAPMTTPTPRRRLPLRRL